MEIDAKHLVVGLTVVDLFEDDGPNHDNGKHGLSWYLRR